MILTTESILTHPKAFGLTTATPVQRAICRMRDGLPLGELATDPHVLEAFGGELAAASLPTGAPPRECHVLAAIRSAKSMISAAGIIRASQTVDVSRCSRGDVIRHPVVSLRLDNTRAVMGHLIANLQDKPLLRPICAIDPDKLTFSMVPLRHPSGAIIEVVPIPLDRAGGSATSFWFAGIDIDEEPRMIGADDGVRNWDHLRDAALGRLLEGGQLFGIGSPWAPFGPIYDIVQEHHGKPSRDMVVVRGRGPIMNPTHWTPERCAELQRQNPTAYATDVLGEFADPESGLITSVEIKAAKRQAPMVLPPLPGRRLYIAACDPGTRGNAFTLIVMGGYTDPEGLARYEITLAKQWVGSSGSPLSPALVFREIAKTITPYGISTVVQDQHSADSNFDLASREGLHLVSVTVGGGVTRRAEGSRDAHANRNELFERMKGLFAEGAIVSLPPDPVLESDLLSVRRRLTQTGLTYVLPKTGDGRHADYVPALCLAVACYPDHATAQQLEARRRQNANNELHFERMRASNAGIDQHYGPSIWERQREAREQPGDEPAYWAQRLAVSGNGLYRPTADSNEIWTVTK